MFETCPNCGTQMRENERTCLHCAPADHPVWEELLGEQPEENFPVDMEQETYHFSPENF